MYVETVKRHSIQDMINRKADDGKLGYAIMSLDLICPVPII